MKENAFEIVIDINKDRDAFAAESLNEIIHIDEMSRIFNLINTSYEEAKTYDPICKEDFKRVYQTITVSGNRGTGKTTFIMSMFHVIKNYPKFIDEKHQAIASIVKNLNNFAKDVFVMDIIDPTLIESKDHVFLNIVARIKELVDKNKANSFSNNYKNRNAFDDYQQWENTLNEFAYGLPCLDGIGKNHLEGEDFMDADFIMDKGLEIEKSVNNLEKNFHKFIAQSLKFLGKKSFIICFDDVDTDMKKGWPVLELLRKYITTPQIIPILSGDLSLYSYLVRNQQWKHFSGDLINDHKDINKFELHKKEVTALEEQYLLKILKSSRRIYLRKLREIDDSDFYRIRIHYQDTTILFKTVFYMPIMRDDLNVKYGNILYLFLSNLSIRQLTQLLRILLIDLNKIEEAIELYIYVFLTELESQGFSYSKLIDNNFKLMDHLLDSLHQFNLLENGRFLFPDQRDVAINKVQFALNRILSFKTYDDSSILFNYLFKIEIPIYCYRLLSEKSTTKSIENTKMDTIKNGLYQIKDFIQLNQFSINLLINTMSEIGQTNKKLKMGNIQVEYDKIKELSLSENFNFLTKIPLISCSNKRDSKSYYYSVYPILGLIAQVCYEIPFNKEVGETKESVDRQIKESIREVFLKSIYKDTNNENKENENYTLISPVCLDDFVESMYAWALSYPKEVFNITVLSKITERFINTVEAIDDHYLNNTTCTCAELLHRYIVGFLNASIVTEASEGYISKRQIMYLSNAVYSDRVFLYNLKRMHHARVGNNGYTLVPNEFLFSKWLLRCPLLLTFMNLNLDPTDNIESIYEEIMVIINESENIVKLSELTDFQLLAKISNSIYSELQNIIIVFEKPKANSKTKEKVVFDFNNPDHYEQMRTELLKGLQTDQDFLEKIFQIGSKARNKIYNHFKNRGFITIKVEYMVKIAQDILNGK